MCVAQMNKSHNPDITILKDYYDYYVPFRYNYIME